METKTRVATELGNGVAFYIFRPKGERVVVAESFGYDSRREDSLSRPAAVRRYRSLIARGYTVVRQWPVDDAGKCIGECIAQKTASEV